MENNFPNEERRKVARIKLRMAVIYHVDKPTTVRMQLEDKEILAILLDLSENGMAISTKYDIPAQTIISIKFTLLRINLDAKVDSYGPIEITGEVRNNIVLEQNNHRLGIYFIKIADKEKAELSKFIKFRGALKNKTPLRNP